MKLPLNELRVRITEILTLLPSDKTNDGKMQYIAGYIDCLKDMGRITSEQRIILYHEFVKLPH